MKSPRSLCLHFLYHILTYSLIFFLKFLTIYKDEGDLTSACEMSCVFCKAFTTLNYVKMHCKRDSVFHFPLFCWQIVKTLSNRQKKNQPTTRRLIMTFLGTVFHGAQHISRRNPPLWNVSTESICFLLLA